MNFDLDCFEQQIPATILDRGWKYYKKGCVTSVGETGPQQFEATVAGTTDYVISFGLKGHEVLDPVCSCPYDGPVCKHVAAVIFYVFNSVAGQVHPAPAAKKATTKAPKAPPKKKSRTEVERVQEIAGKLSAEEMRAFLVSAAELNPAFVRQFLSQFAHLDELQTQKTFAVQLRSALRVLKNRQGYIDYHKSHMVFEAGQQLLDPASGQLLSGNYAVAWKMAAAVLEVFMEALGDADDSDGSMGSCIHEAAGLLDQIACADLPETVRSEFFAWCLLHYSKGSFAGWDEHGRLMDYCITMVETKEEGGRLLKELAKLQPSGTDWDPGMRTAEKQQYHLLKKMGEEEAARSFLERHLNNPDLREEAIRNSVEQQDFDEGIRLAEEGIQQHQAKYPGLADRWRRHLLHIYRAKGDMVHVQSIALYLLTAGNEDAELYYLLLREVTAAADWAAMVDRIVDALKIRGHFRNTHKLAQIYIWEHRMEALFELLQEQRDLSALEYYEKYLPESFRPRLNGLYLSAIDAKMQYQNDRRGYAAICTYLRRLKKRGAIAMVNDYVEELKSRYPQRKALLEELQMV